jgi:hypothetical protein
MGITMDTTIKLFKTEKAREQYFTAYDSSLMLWPVPTESHLISTPMEQPVLVNSRVLKFLEADNQPDKSEKT